MTPLTIGLSANATGAHTQELLDGLADAERWTGLSCDVIWQEDGRDPERAEEAARAMVAAGVPLVLGHLSAAACLSASEVYRAHDVALVAPATSHPALNADRWPGILRVCGRDDITAARMVAQIDGDARVSLIAQDQIYGASLAACLRQALAARNMTPCGDVVLGDAAPPPPLPPGVNYLLISGIHEFCAEVLQQVARDRLDVTFILGDDCLTDNFLHLGGPSAIGSKVICPIVPGFADVAQGYRPAAAIAASVALQALLQMPNGRGRRLGERIRAQTWETPHGTFGFDGRGDLRGLETRAFTVTASGFRGAPDRTMIEPTWACRHRTLNRPEFAGGLNS